MTTAMSIELTMLLYSVILTFVLIGIPATEAILRNGIKLQGGNRDDLPEPPVFHKRANRLVANMLENMAMFVPLILIASIAGVSTEYTVLGAQLFFYARIAHAICYLAGWPWVRPLFWAIGIGGIVMIALALL